MRLHPSWRPNGMLHALCQPRNQVLELYSGLFVHDLVVLQKICGAHCGGATHSFLLCYSGEGDLHMCCQPPKFSILLFIVVSSAFLAPWSCFQIALFLAYYWMVQCFSRLSFFILLYAYLKLQYQLWIFILFCCIFHSVDVFAAFCATLLWQLTVSLSEVQKEFSLGSFMLQMRTCGENYQPDDNVSMHIPDTLILKKGT